MSVTAAEVDAEPTTKQRVRHKPPPKVLVLRCDKCSRRVGRGGYLKIDRLAVASHTDGEIPTYWKILHPECDSDAKNTDYRLYAHLFSTTSDLLEATAFLLRNEPWIINTNWHGLIGRVLADTREFADALIDVKRQAWRECRRERDRERERERYREKRNGNGIEIAVLEEDDDD